MTQTNVRDWIDLGKKLEAEGRDLQAVAVYQKALRKTPDFWPLHLAIGNVFHRRARYAEAIEAYQSALKIDSACYETWYNLANSHADAGNREEAIRCQLRAVELKKDFELAYKELAVLLLQEGRIDDAEAMAAEALRLKPDFAEAYSARASLRARQGRVGEAIADFRKALECNPGLREVHSNLLFYLNFDTTNKPEEIFAEYKKWESVHAQDIKPILDELKKTKKRNGKIRLGFVSPDFREHVVGMYLRILLSHIDRERFDIFLYANVTAPDAETTWFRTMANDQWRDIVGVADEQVAEMVRQDGIDILIDLAGHMAGSRLLLFVRKPAPVQATLWGYPGTTGLSAMDARITDEWMDPAGTTEAFHSEKLLRLPRCVFAYRPLTDSPELTKPPFEKNGLITFGSLNNFAKVSNPAVALWSRILNELPDARLRVLVQGGKESAGVVRKRFGKHGIAPERIECCALCGRGTFLELHNTVDIALDPFPYTGGMTTLEALWMGVPVVTLAGKMPHERHGVSILNSLGEPDWIARDEDEYFQKTIALARDSDKLRDLRASLRGCLQTSPLMDEVGFTHAFEEIFLAATATVKYGNSQ